MGPIMNIHNIMEDLVSSAINKLYNQVKTANLPWLTCDCENCRLDAISYVLNRVPPKYIVSGRGATYCNQILQDRQLIADINALGIDAIRVISSTKRPFHSFPREKCAPESNEKPTFNFPIITGSILDGQTFEPISNATIELKQNGITMEMVDMTWTNPTTTFQSTKGMFSFWPKAIPAEKQGINRKFNFELVISAPKYESIVHYFEVNVLSDKKQHTELNSVYSVKIQDLVLFESELTTE